MKNKTDLRRHKAVAILIAACIAAFAVLVFVQGPEIITKQVTGLKLVQEGFNLKVRWDDMDCQGYHVTVTCEGKKVTLPETKKNHFTIKNASLDKVYSIRIWARLNSGKKSRVTKAAIRTERLPNKVKVSTENFDGFKKDSFTIKASGTGDIAFASENEKIASVSENGKVILHKKGETRILVTASGDGTYMPGEAKVEVRVFPETIGQVQSVEAENITGSTARLTWKPVEFATKYYIWKKNAATGKLEYLKTVKNEKTSTEIVRNTGRYAVSAKAVIGEKTATGRASETFEVKGATENMESYSSWRNLRTLDRSNLDVFRTVRGDGSCKVPQSISVTKDCYVISYVNSSGTEGKLCSYRKSDGECIDISPCSGMGHANGTTYDPNKNRFFVVKTHKSFKTASCSVYNGTTKESEGTFDLPRVTSGIAYDESNNKYYLSKGNEIYVCDSKFNVEKFIHKKVRYNHAQDIGAYNGIVFVCTWVSGNSSYIDMYRASDGAYLGGYDVSFGEVESCFVDDGYLVILMNNAVGDGDCIYRTKERLPII